MIHNYFLNIYKNIHEMFLTFLNIFWDLKKLESSSFENTRLKYLCFFLQVTDAAITKKPFFF